MLARDENMDTNFNQPINIQSTDGCVSALAEPGNTLPYRLLVKIPTGDGFIWMVDYSSVNSWSGKKVCTWLPKIR